MEKYYKVNKNVAARVGLDELLRTKIGDDFILSETDIRNITLTIEEKIKGIGATEYLKDDVYVDNDLPSEEVNNDLPE